MEDEEFELWGQPDDAVFFQRAHPRNPRRRPILPGVSWSQVDTTLHAALDAAPLDAAILLTPHSATEWGSGVYVYFEPILNLVIALGYAEGRASISADPHLWDDRGPAFEGVIADVEARLRQGRIADALLLVADRLPEIARAAAGSPSGLQRPRRRHGPA
jgi:hypothetical protein